jgi:hypothetical protein
MTLYLRANGVLSDYWMTYELPRPGLGSMSFLITGSDAAQARRARQLSS